MRKIRQAVSLKKKRFQEDGYDLDLTYILDNPPRLVAMGFPSIGKEALYRNPRSEVKRLLETKHAGHYKLWNLCVERSYDHSQFSGPVSEEYAFMDHQAPPFEIMEPFCKSLDEYLKEDEQNCAFVHCKAGKGRTGVMTCAYLIYSGMYPDPIEAMDYYAHTRTHDLKGVNIPGQRRYVIYFGEAMKRGGKPPYPNRTIKLKKFKFGPCPFGGMNMTFKIKDRNWDPLYNYLDHCPVRRLGGHEEEIVVDNLDNTPILKDDIFFDFRSKRVKTKKVFQFWLNTNFLDDSGCIRLTKEELDSAWKDKHHKKFDKNFYIEVYYETIDDEDEEDVHEGELNRSERSGGKAKQQGNGSNADGDQEEDEEDHAMPIPASSAMAKHADHHIDENGEGDKPNENIDNNNDNNDNEDNNDNFDNDNINGNNNNNNNIENSDDKNEKENDGNNNNNDEND